jgi:NADPH:quinone reductase-like Zn-dependent oxidoreductase
VATASEKNHEFLRSLGAEPVTYGEGLAGRLAEVAPEGLDAVVDFVGGEDRDASLEHLKSPERVASVTDAEVKDRGGRYIFVRPNPADLLALTELVEAGSVKPVLAESFPLERAADAFRSSMDGHVRGKIAVTVGEQG